MTGTWGNTPTHSLKELCEVTHEACDILQPMIKAFYAKCNESYGTAKLKQDATFFSIADGIVQHLMVNYFLAGNKFHEIVGEEDDCDVNITTKPFTVDELVVPEEFESLVETTRNKIIQLAKKVDGESYKGISVFVDPIDGTREFATGKGDFCSVLVGYNNLIGQPVAGIMYRPLTNPPTWAAGAKSENVVMGRLDKAKKPNPKGVLVSDGVNTPFLLQVRTFSLSSFSILSSTRYFVIAIHTYYIYICHHHHHHHHSTDPSLLICRQSRLWATKRFHATPPAIAH